MQEKIRKGNTWVGKLQIYQKRGLHKVEEATEGWQKRGKENGMLTEMFAGQRTLTPNKNKYDQAPLGRGKQRHERCHGEERGALSFKTSQQTRGGRRSW